MLRMPTGAAEFNGIGLPSSPVTVAVGRERARGQQREEDGGEGKDLAK